MIKNNENVIEKQMKAIKEIESELLEDFEMFSDWNDKYNYIMDMGAELPLIDEKHKNEKTKVEGCQSASWLEVENRQGNLFFKGDSEAILGKGVIAMLLNLLNGHNAQDIANYNFRLIDKIDLINHLSPTRKLGLESVIKRIKELANENI